MAGPRRPCQSDKERAAQERHREDARFAPGKQRDRIEFASSETYLGKKVCVLDHVGLTFDAPRVLFDDFSMEIAHGAKIGIVGPNGSGKTSLLKIIAGRLEPTKGSVELGQTVRLSFFEQTNEAVDGELSVLDFIQEQCRSFPPAGRVHPGCRASSGALRF